jgi:hypothetical protein
MLSDVLKAIKGNFSIVVSDFQQTSGVANGAMQQIPSVKMIANIAVGDKVQMNRLMDNLVERQLMVKTPQGYALPTQLRNLGFEVTVDDKNIYLAKDAALLNQYKLKSTKATLPNDVINDFKGKSGIMYMNIESILNGVANQNDSTLIKARATFKDARGYMNNFNGKSVESHYELRFKDEKENSLTSLLAFFTTASRNAKTTVTVDAGDRDSVPMALPELGK